MCSTNRRDLPHSTPFPLQWIPTNRRDLAHSTPFPLKWIADTRSWLWDKVNYSQLRHTVQYLMFLFEYSLSCKQYFWRSKVLIFNLLWTPGIHSAELIPCEISMPFVELILGDIDSMWRNWKFQLSSSYVVCGRKNTPDWSTHFKPADNMAAVGRGWKVYSCLKNLHFMPHKIWPTGSHTVPGIDFPPIFTCK